MIATAVHAGRAREHGWRAPSRPTLVGLALLVGLVVFVLVTTPPMPRPSSVDVGDYFSPADLRRIAALHRALRPPAYGSYTLGLVWAAILGFSPLGAKIVGVCGRRWWVQALVGSFALQALLLLEALPADVRGEQVLRHYGVSTATWGQWAQVLAITFLSSAVVTSGLLMVVVALARRFPKRWWLGLGVVGAVFVFGASFLYPVLVQPLTATVKPMPAGHVRDELEAVAAADGKGSVPLYVSSAAAPSTSENALTIGFGPTRGITFFDTIVASSSDAELESVMGHELGHVRNHDVLRGTLEGSVALLAVGCLAPALLSVGRGSKGPSDPRVVALALGWITLLTALVGPFEGAVSRRIEARADMHSLAVTHDPQAFADSEVQLTLSALQDPDPPSWIQILFGDHPTAQERLGYARDAAGR